ncbi:MAG TPA: hypothetical protein VL383_08370 [Gemmatimonadaceae bacterium]|jgi:hypothetical protein|nr:hypothetical protein [Gemmatimonadaceae bacterium]
MTLGMGLLPIAPILLLPVILVVFVIVFPLWVVALAVVGFILVLVRVLDKLARLAGTELLSGAASGMHRAFRWVLTFGGLAEKVASGEAHTEA